MKSAELGEVTSNTAKTDEWIKGRHPIYKSIPRYNPKDPGHQPHPPSQCPFVRSTLVACQKRDLLNAGAVFSTKGLQKHPTHTAWLAPSKQIQKQIQMRTKQSQIQSIQKLIQI